MSLCCILLISVFAAWATLLLMFGVHRVPVSASSTPKAQNQSVQLSLKTTRGDKRKNVNTLPQLTSDCQTCPLTVQTRAALSSLKKKGHVCYAVCAALTFSALSDFHYCCCLQLHTILKLLFHLSSFCSYPCAGVQHSTGVF